MGGAGPKEMLTDIFTLCWNKSSIPPELHDVTVIFTRRLQKKKRQDFNKVTECQEVQQLSKGLNTTEKLVNVTLQSLIVNEKEDIELKFELSFNVPYNVVIYMFYDIQGAPYRNLCKKTCPDEGRTCLCYSRADKNKLLTYSPVLLIFNVTRNSLDSMLQCSWRTSLLPYVVPGCVQELKVDSVSSIAANASSLLSYQLKRLIDFMPDGHRLSLHVELRKNAGVTEVHQFEVLPSFDNPLDVYLFETLSPFTLYTVSVMTMAGTDKGCVKSLSFQTLKSGPLAPPELTGFDLSGSKLWLVWKVLSPEVAGSDKVTYELVISSANGVNYTYNQRSNLFNETLENIQGPLTISLWALNDVGKSEKSTVVNIPLNQMDVELNPVVEVINKSHMSIKTSAWNLVEQIAVHAISSEMTLTQDLCATCVWTDRQVVNVSRAFVTSKKRVPLEFVLSFTKMETRKLQREVKYCQLNAESSSIQEECSISMSNLTQTENTSVNLLSNSDLSPKDLKPELKVVRTSNCFVLYGQPSSGDVTLNATFFISFKINGTFQRLKQISCFYNRQHNELFNANIKACVLNGCLHVHQIQNCSKPEQFFIQSFNVYPSLDGTTCNSTLRAFPHCLKDTEWSLPGDVKSVCIQARDSLEIDHGPPQLINIAQLASSDSHSSTNTVIYGFVGVLVLFAVVIILRVVYTCVKRRNQILKLVGSTNESLDIAQTTPNFSIATKDVSQLQSVQSKNCEDQTSTHGIFLDWLSGSSYARFSRLDKSLGRSNSMGACTNDSSPQSVSNTSDSSITQLL
nr:hypothetical protein BgiMline_032098 [Biomphalaria glabrata]